MGTKPSPPKGHRRPQFSAHICCGQMAAWIKITWYGAARPRPRRLCVRWGPRSPSPKGGRSHPKFLAHVYCDQTAGWIKMVLGMEVGLSLGNFVLDGDPVLFPKRVEPPPQFSAHFYCGQTPGCIKMPLGMELGLSPGDFVLDGDQALYPKGAEPHPIFGPRLLWPKGCMDQDAT